MKKPDFKQLLRFNLGTRVPDHILQKCSMFLLVCITVFVMPHMIYAYTRGIPEDQIAEAEMQMQNYQEISLDIFASEEEFVIEDPTIHPEYHSDCNYYLFSGYYTLGQKITSRVWKHAQSLYRQGLIHGSTTSYQCTLFAQMWFYDVYGFNSTRNMSSGNGKDVAYRVYAANTYYDEEGNLKHYFRLSSEPESMSILSISGISNPYGHVMCIDEVDHVNGTITFSDGNVTNHGDIRIRVTMTIEEFNRKIPGYKIYAVPTEELLELLNND
ncbi:MAG: CHAP domain-containing protein [Erysipelotrichaceae bacterium]|nr:CHAP domain-containing protein [Erysipelotrichaceae bacterium]